MLGLVGLCLALLSVARCASTKNVASVEPIDHHCQEVPQGQIIIPGSGTISNYQPYHLTSMSLGPESTSIELYTNSGEHCILGIPGKLGAYPRYEILQVSPKIMYLKEYEIFKTNRNQAFSVDVSDCTVHDPRGKVRRGRVLSSIYYEDGYDEVYRENDTGYRRSFDVAGNQIGQPKTFLLDSLRDSGRNQMLVTWPKSRASNLVAVAYGPLRSKADGGSKMHVTLVDADGRLIKNLLTFKYSQLLRVPIAYDTNGTAYTFCYHGESDYECAQFDLSGNELFRNSLSYSSQLSGDNVRHTLLSVRNLKDGPGFVLFTATYEREIDPATAYAPPFTASTSPNIVTVTASEMRPGQTIENSYRLANKQNDLVIVTDYDQVSARFTVREGMYHSRNICWSTFSLAAEHE